MAHRIRIVFRDGQCLFPNHSGQIKLNSKGWLAYHMVSDAVGFTGHIPFQSHSFDLDHFQPQPDREFSERNGYTALLESGPEDNLRREEIVLPPEVYEAVIKAIAADIEPQRTAFFADDFPKFRDEEKITILLLQRVPLIQINELKKSNPGDGGGIWRFGMPGTEYGIQIESITGDCPFVLEAKNGERLVLSTVEDVVSKIMDLLSSGPKAE